MGRTDGLGELLVKSQDGGVAVEDVDVPGMRVSAVFTMTQSQEETRVVTAEFNCRAV